MEPVQPGHIIPYHRGAKLYIFEIFRAFQQRDQCRGCRRFTLQMNFPIADRKPADPGVIRQQPGKFPEQFYGRDAPVLLLLQKIDTAEYGSFFLC